MTREEAKHIVDVAFNIPLAVGRIGEDRIYHEDEVREAKNMAIKALEQEPCDDCISREQAKGAIRDRFKDLPSRVEINTILNELPSVTPQQKNGKWLKGNSYGDQYNYYQSCVCSYCKREYDVHGWKYCPNCGAKMEVENNGIRTGD